MTALVQSCPQCGSAIVSRDGSTTMCLTCLGRRLLSGLVSPEEGGDCDEFDASSAATPNDLAALATPQIGPGGAVPPSVAPPAVPDRLGNYEILEELGHGGMGVVYSARHVHLDRVVALKVIRRGAWATAEEESRFLREAQAAARVRYPGIVTVYDVGREGTWLFYAMEWCEGGDLARRVAGSLPAVRTAAEWLETVARALHRAHKAGLVHRDLKPSNILLDAEDQPRVADFGLARWTQEAAELTRSGAILGSPAFMAPEQARGEVAPAADIYALGAVLFFTLTGRPPHEGTAYEVLARAAHEDAAPPSAHRAEVPPALDAVCLRALARIPVDRYPSAEALADDLRRWLDGENVSTAYAPPAEARRLLEAVQRRVRQEGIQRTNYAELEADLARVVQLAPQLAPGWAWIARVHASMFSLDLDGGEGRRALVEGALQRAEKLDPDDPEVRSARAHYWGTLGRDKAASLAAYRALAKEFPDDVHAQLFAGRSCWANGLWHEGNAALARVALLEPDVAQHRQLVAYGHFLVRDFREGVTWIDAALRIDPKPLWRRLIALWLHWQLDPFPKRALSQLARHFTAEERKMTTVAWLEMQFHLADDNPAAALAAFRPAVEQATPDDAPHALHDLAHQLRLEQLAGDPGAERTAQRIDAMLAPGRTNLGTLPENLMSAAYAHAMRGRAQEAMNLCEAALQLRPWPQSALDGARLAGHNEFATVPGRLLLLALLGETEQLITELAKWINVPCAVDVRTLAFDPAFAAARRDPRFLELLATAACPIPPPAPAAAGA
jgi:tetratricopeptide (TPR) repeat protein